MLAISDNGLRLTRLGIYELVAGNGGSKRFRLTLGQEWPAIDSDELT